MLDLSELGLDKREKGVYGKSCMETNGNKREKSY
jgi:hypothetical protein